MTQERNIPDVGHADPDLVLIVDNDHDVRRSLSALFRAARMPTETYPDALALLEALPRFGGRRGCVVTDLRMPVMDGVALVRELRRRDVGSPVVVMTGHGDVASAVQAMKAGAFDFIEKPFAPEAILKTVREALKVAKDPSFGTATGSDHGLGMAAKAAARVAALSSREREVFDLVAVGKPNKVIAHELGLSPRTVEMHRANMMQRLGVRTLSDVVRLAIMVDLAVARNGREPNGSA